MDYGDKVKIARNHRVSPSNNRDLPYDGASSVAANPKAIMGSRHRGRSKKSKSSKKNSEDGSGDSKGSSSKKNSPSPTKEPSNSPTQTPSEDAVLFGVLGSQEITHIDFEVETTTEDGHKVHMDRCGTDINTQGKLFHISHDIVSSNPQSTDPEMKEHTAWLIAETITGTKFDTKISVFVEDTDESGDISLLCVGGNDDIEWPINRLSKFIWSREPEKNYFVFVHGFVDLGGNFKLKICHPVGDSTTCARNLNVA